MKITWECLLISFIFGSVLIGAAQNLNTYLNEQKTKEKFYRRSFTWEKKNFLG